ncbi:MAG: carbon-nitrogen hydrolase family protein [Dehalococcoidales bacterium]|nr:MAG: carbon-nitrogen hydrolase family protein [Dehalococcoidales bacterium]
MGDNVKIAGAQINPIILDVNGNLNKCLDFTKKATNQGAKLVIFPEAALTGYCYSSLEEAIPVAETIPGPSTEAIISLCKELNTYVIVGLIEKENDKYYNAAAFLGPEGLIGRYRKLHLPYLGIDRYLNYGDQPLTVCDTEIGRIGMGICIDMAFPEHSRVLALQDADVVVNITNWPGKTIDPNFLHFVNVRASENTIYYIAVNRVGHERGWDFFGSSIEVDPMGNLVGQAPENQEGIFHFEVDPKVARQKHHTFVPGQFELDLILGRRPEFYGDIVKPLEDNSRIR